MVVSPMVMTAMAVMVARATGWPAWGGAVPIFA